MFKTQRKMAHNLEADHLANVCAERQRNITVDKGTNKEKGKAVKDFWDESSKN